MSYKSVREILNAVFDSDDNVLNSTFKDEGELLNLVLDETGKAIRVRIDGEIGGTVDAYTKAESDALLDVKADKTALRADNLLINSCGRINQRGYVSGTATTAVNQYTLDRWRVVTSGQNLTFATSGNLTTFTAPAGGVEQVIEGLNVRSGTYTLSWEGTATATINGITVGNGEQITLVGGANTTVRFLGGTFSKPKLEYGSNSTVYTTAPYAEEETACQRYCYKSMPGYTSSFGISANNASTVARVFIIFPVSMRIAPTSVGHTGTPTDYRLNTVSGFICTAVPAFNASTSTSAVVIFTTTGLTTGQAGVGQANAAGAYLLFDVEL